MAASGRLEAECAVARGGEDGLAIGGGIHGGEHDVGLRRQRRAGCSVQLPLHIKQRCALAGVDGTALGGVQLGEARRIALLQFIVAGCNAGELG